MIKDDFGKILFTDDELKCKSTGIVFTDEIFEEKLKTLRIKYGNPMHINSCCRSAEHNAKTGGVKNSFHIFDISKNIKTCAVDISLPPAPLKVKLIMLALQEGFSVGLHKKFIHLDYRISRNFNQTIFLY